MKKTVWIIVLLLTITAVSVTVTVWTLFFRDTDVVLAPDYAPVETEPNAEAIPGDNSDRAESDKGGGSVSLTYSTQITIDLRTNSVSLFFANPSKSNHDMLLQIVIQDTVLVQSGRLTPGKQVTRLELSADSADMLQPGGYEGNLLIFYYDQESGEKAMINTEIPVSITVKE